MNLSEAVKAEISPAANRRRVSAYRAQEGHQKGGGSYTFATDPAAGRSSAKKIIRERQLLG